jgi:hypothetical protein
MAADRDAAGDGGGTSSQLVGTDDDAHRDDRDERGAGANHGPRLPRRYYGRATLDSLRWTRQVADIAEAIVTQLAKSPDTTLKITLDVEAEAESGFSEATQRTVSENAAVLKLDISEFDPD